MYVTRPLSLYRNSPNSVTEPTPEGPNSGILVVEDAEAEAQDRCCFGLFKTSRVSKLPFPQNKIIQARYKFRLGYLQQTYSDDVFFVPVLDQPLSSNRYYVIRAHGKDKGKTCTCSKEEDATESCFCTIANDIGPQRFDPQNVYQQVEIINCRNKFYAKALASDGIPPHFLRRRLWRAYASEPFNFTLREAQGINARLRAQMPDTDYPISTKYPPSLIVGKWYCPFIFIKEGTQLIKEQMRKSMFYEMSLEQKWEEVYSCENSDGEGKGLKVGVGVDVIREMPFLTATGTASAGYYEIKDGLIWFKDVDSSENGFGLSLLLWERMRWEQKRGGFVGEERVERIEEIYKGEIGWKKFGCYVLVERFVVKRMNGSIVFVYEFKHTNKVRIKWE